MGPGCRGGGQAGPESGLEAGMRGCRGTSGPREGLGPGSTRIGTPVNQETGPKGTRTITLVPCTLLARDVLLKDTVGIRITDEFIDSLIFLRQQLLWNWWAGCVEEGKDFRIWTFLLSKGSSSKQKNNRNISLGAQPGHTMPPFLPGQKAFGASPLVGVCSPEPACRTYPLVLRSTKPLTATPNANASFTAGLCHVWVQLPGPLKAPSAEPSWDSCGWVSPLPFGDKENDAFAIIQSPSWATRHDVKQPSSLKGARGDFLLKNWPL